MDRSITYIGPRDVRFSPEKFAEYSCDRDLKKEITEEDVRGPSEVMYAYVFQIHNVELYVSALLLRNWAMAYQNEALKSLRKQGIF